jgi:hypothetical protein
MYATLFQREDPQLLYYIDHIVGENVNKDFYKNYFGEGERSLESFLINALRKDDLKLAHFILNEPFTLGENNSWFDFKIKDLLKEKCREGKLTTLKYICENEEILQHNESPTLLYELISIACINGHLDVAKFLSKHFKKKSYIFMNEKPSDEIMKIVYSKTLKNGHKKAADWLALKFKIDPEIDIDDYFEEEWEVSDEESEKEESD